jgi:hypothetical protein
MEFHVLLKRILKEQKLNRVQASKICDIYPQQFGSYVSGKNIPSYKTALEIIEKLNWRLIPTVKDIV